MLNSNFYPDFVRLLRIVWGFIFIFFLYINLIQDPLIIRATIINSLRSFFFRFSPRFQAYKGAFRWKFAFVSFCIFYFPPRCLLQLSKSRQQRFWKRCAENGSRRSRFSCAAKVQIASVSTDECETQISVPRRNFGR